MKISIATEFSEYPAGRYNSDGPYNATRFRQEILVPALKSASQRGEPVIVLLDGVGAYSSSFLEEAFGGLAREEGMTKKLLGLLEIQAMDPAYFSAQLDAQQYLRAAIDRAH